MKDKTMVVRMLSGAFSSGSKDDVPVDGEKEQPKATRARPRSTAGKFSPVSMIPRGAPVIDLDGPMANMVGWVGGVGPGGKVVGGKKGSVGGLGTAGKDSLDQMAEGRWKGKPRGND